MVGVVLIVVIVFLMSNKNKYSKYQSISEEANKFYINQNNNVIEEINDTKVIQEDVDNVKQMMKTSHK